MNLGLRKFRQTRSPIAHHVIVTPNESPQTTSAVGPVRYSLFVRSADSGGEHDSNKDVSFVVNGLTLPRVGDDLNFAVDPDTQLVTTVVKVEQWFFAEEQEEPHSMITVDAEASSGCHELVRKLRAPAELEQWVAQFPMLEIGTY